MDGMSPTETTCLRAPRRLLTAIAATLVLAIAPWAVAAGGVQSSPSPEGAGNLQSQRPITNGRWSLDAGTGLMLSLSSVEEQDDDVVSSSEFGFGELALSALYQVAEPLGVGARASWGTDLGQRGRASSSGESIDLNRSLSQISLAARYQVTRGHSWALGGNAGAAAISDSVGEASVTQWAPVVAASVGYDFRLASQLALGLELRASYARFSKGGRTVMAPGDAAPGATAFRYGPTSWLGVHLTGRWLP